MSKLTDLSEKLSIKYGQAEIVSLKDSVIRIFQSVNASATELLNAHQELETSQMLKNIILQLSSYLANKQVSLPEYFNFVKTLASNPKWGKIDKTYKTVHIMKPLEIAYAWLGKPS